MIDKHDTLSLFCNDRLRASCFVNYFWQIIEDRFLYVLGITETSTVSVYVDDDSIIFSATSNYDSLCAERYVFYYNHVLTLMTDLCISMTINFISSDIKLIKYDMCSFYYEEKNKEDDGVIEIYCDAYYNIKTYEDFKLEMCTQLCKELQYLIHRNVLKSNINNCKIAKLDSKYETVNMYKKIKNISFKKSATEMLEKDLLNIDEYNNISEIRKKIENELREQEFKCKQFKC